MKSRRTVFSLGVLLLLFLISGSLHAGDGMIEKVNFQEEGGGIESVIFHLDGPWLPKVFALKGEHPRVVFDFMETRMARGVPASIDARGKMIRKIRMGRHSNKTRVVIDLTAGGEFNFDQQFDEKNNILTIQLFAADFPAKEEQDATLEKNPGSEVVVTEQAAGKQELESGAVQEKTGTAELEQDNAAGKEDGPVVDPLLLEVSFENTSNKGEMVLFKLNGFYPPVVTGEEEGTPLVICDFSGTRLGSMVEKEQIIEGEFIEKIKVAQVAGADRIQVILELIPNKNYDLQQVFFKEDDLFVIIVNSYDPVDKAKTE